MPRNPPIALITGSAKRVGAVIARRLHEAGFDLALHYRRSEAEMVALRAELEAVRPGSTAAFSADLGDTDALPAMVEAV
ncbi:MAG: pteridine reductase, partial [Gammaproteobacteria bacterium HGW-Gammaproteobacteria-7]